MPPPHDIQTFDALSEKYSTWIIKYCSPTYQKPLFFVWYTDENGTDKFLTYKIGEIFATNTLIEFRSTLIHKKDALEIPQTLNLWLDHFNHLVPIESCTYDINFILNSLDKNVLDIHTIESFVNFINVYGDFVQQDESNNHLQVYADHELIQEAWNYFYEFIFWPRFNDKEKFEAWDRPPLEIDTAALSTALKVIIKNFEDRIKNFVPTKI